LLETLDKPGGRGFVDERNGFRFDAESTIITAPFLLNELGRYADDASPTTSTCARWPPAIGSLSGAPSSSKGFAHARSANWAASSRTPMASMPSAIGQRSSPE
jgi:phytoene dehydrogenase-like protein